MQSKVCGQCFNVRVEAGDVPHGSALGLVLFNIFDSTLSKSACGTMLGGAADIPGG